MATDVKVPALGESITEGTLAQWLKKPGEAVAAGRADRQPRDRQGQRRGAVAGRRRADRATGQGRRHGRGRRGDRADRRRRDGGRRADVRRRPPLRRRPTPPGAGENPALRGDEHAPSRAATGDRVARRPRSPRCRRRCAARCSNIMSTRRRIRGTGKDGRLTKDDVIAAAKAQRAVPRRRPGPRRRRRKRRHRASTQGCGS